MNTIPRDSPTRTKPCGFCGAPPGGCPRLGPLCSNAWTRGRAAECTPVVAVLVRRHDEFLLCRRPAHKRHGGLWEFPGGKLLPDETIGEAVRRELAEELQIDLVELLAYHGSEKDPGSEFLLHFVEAVATGEPAALEHDEVAWVGLGDLERLTLAPGDRTFVERWRRGPASTS